MILSAENIFADVLVYDLWMVGFGVVAALLWIAVFAFVKGSKV